MKKSQAVSKHKAKNTSKTNAPSLKGSAKITSVAKGANQARSSQVRSALGRGLSALMSVSKPVPVSSGALGERWEGIRSAEDQVVAKRTIMPAVEATNTSLLDSKSVVIESITHNEENVGGLESIRLEQLTTNSAQPRKRFTEQELQSLANSIRESGVLQPILVRPIERSSEGVEYQIVAGERRYRAAKLAGLTEVPVVVRKLSDREALQLGIVENVQRADLNPIEEAQAYQRLIEEFNESQADVAKAVGKDRASIANTLRLLKLAGEVQQQLVNGELTAGHGRALLMLENHVAQRSLAEEVVREGLSVREAERRAQGLRPASSSRPNSKTRTISTPNPAKTELEERLRRALGTKVAVEFQGNGQGELRISFFSAGELESLLEKLGA